MVSSPSYKGYTNVEGFFVSMKGVVRVMQEKMDMLRLLPMFRDLTEEEIEKIWGISIPRAYRKRTVVFTEGSDKEAVYFIQDGLVKAYKTDENGHEHIVSFLKTGDMFPHTGFFNQNPYPATAEVIVDTQLIAIPVRSFEQLLLNIPAISIKLMRAMSEKIKELQDKFQELTGNDVQDRGLLFLIKLAENYGTLRDGVVYINVPMTNQEFADTIGSTRETVNRFINQLRKENIIETNRNGYIIQDYEALKNWTRK
jgi:CRP/FNR family cyclic AMP-dependent transcriptional regulator